MSASTDIAERHTATCDLFADAIRQFRTQQLKAGGNSMRPAIWPGDHLVIEATEPADIAIGDVVAFRRHSSIVAHRVVATLALPSGIHVVTRGDRLRANDQPVEPSALLGRVTAVRRGPFRFDPRLSAGFGWRAASALLECALACRRLMSYARRRADARGSWTPVRAS